MPNYKGHLVGGSVAFFVTFVGILNAKASLLQSIEWFCFTLLGSLFPDIDVKSKGQKIFYRVVLCTLIYLLLMKCYGALITLSFLSCIPLVVRHRGICHSLWFIIVVPSSVIIVSQFYFPVYCPLIFWDALFFIVGAVSHIVLDFGLKKIVRL